MKLYISTLVLVILIMSSSIAGAIAPMDSVHYIVASDGNDINSLEINLGYELDNINNINVSLIYDGDDFNLTGSWLIDFIERYDHKVNIGVSVVSELNGISPDVAVGVGGQGNYLSNNIYFWNLDYLFADDEDWIYRAGIGLPVSKNSKLTFSLGNSLWQSDENTLEMGMEIDI